MVVSEVCNNKIYRVHTSREDEANNQGGSFNT